MELFANGQSLGVKEAADHFFYFDVPNVGETTLVAVAGECRDESTLRKVEEFNEDYRLKEKGAILNWFDITEKEGYYSRNDKMGDIMQSVLGKAWFATLMLTLKKKMDAGKKPSEDGEKKKGGFSFNVKDIGNFTQMLGGFTVLRMTSMMGMVNISFTKEELLKLNSQLNKIRKPKKLRK